jgi:hypothetical protein
MRREQLQAHRKRTPRVNGLAGHATSLQHLRGFVLVR